MIISITSSAGTAEELQPVEDFLQDFLPRLRAFPGVKAIYHYARYERGDTTTLIIWENEDALRAYRVSDLGREARAFEKETGLPSAREDHPLKFVG